LISDNIEKPGERQRPLLGLVTQTENDFDSGQRLLDDGLRHHTPARGATPPA